MAACLEYSVDASTGIATMEMNRPKVRNAFDDGLFNAITDGLRKAEHDSSVAVVVLTGRGSYFSSGADLKVLATQHELKNTSIADRPAGRFMQAMLRFPKVLVGAVNGPAVGIAVTLLPLCDLVFCTASATFWAPFYRLSIVPEMCSSVTFADAMGLAKANDMLLLNKKLSAQGAVDANLVSEILPSSPGVVGSSSESNVVFLEAVKRKLMDGMLSLPHAFESALIFKEAVQCHRRGRLRVALQAEFEVMDRRFREGRPQAALKALMKGGKL